MVDFVEMYLALVMSGKINIDKVPIKYREKVREALNA